MITFFTTGISRILPGLPTPPTMRRRPCGTPGGIFGLEFDRINSGAPDPAGEYAGRGVEPGSRRRIRAVQNQAFSFDGEGQKEIAAGPYAENGRSMKAGRMKHSAHTVTLPSG